MDEWEAKKRSNRKYKMLETPVEDKMKKVG